MFSLVSFFVGMGVAFVVFLAVAFYALSNARWI